MSIVQITMERGPSKTLKVTAIYEKGQYAEFQDPYYDYLWYEVNISLFFAMITCVSHQLFPPYCNIINSTCDIAVISYD